MLGMAEQHCKFDFIIKNKYVSKTCVEAALKAIDKLLGKEVKPKRNLVVHQRQHNEECLEAAEMYSALQKYDSQDDNEDSQTNRYSVFVSSITNKFVRDKKAQLSRFNQELFSEVKRLLDTLESQFVVRHSASKKLSDLVMPGVAAHLTFTPPPITSAAECPEQAK